MTVARMKSMPTDDDAFGSGRIRVDGRGEFPSYLLQVKAPSESKGEWISHKRICDDAGVGGRPST